MYNKERLKLGIELIAEERGEHKWKHNRTIEDDYLYNNKYQLSRAAVALANKYNSYNDFNYLLPEGWSRTLWEKMYQKPYKERLIIAGALIAAEIDRLNYIENDK